MRTKRSPVHHRPGPDTTDFDLEARDILAEVGCEAWVLSERERISEARLRKRAWASALGLRGHYSFTAEEIRRVAAWDRMLREAA